MPDTFDNTIGEYDATTGATINANFINGQGVNVAILDTGVDVTHPDLQGTVDRSVAVVAQGPGLVCRDVQANQLPAAELDPVGHGTACAGIIHELAPAARLISVRVIGASAVGTGEQFVRGLQWVLEQRGLIASAFVRPPLIPLTASGVERVRALLDEGGAYLSPVNGFTMKGVQ